MTVTQAKSHFRIQNRIADGIEDAFKEITMAEAKAIYAKEPVLWVLTDAETHKLCGHHAENDPLYCVFLPSFYETLKTEADANAGRLPAKEFYIIKEE